MSDFKTLSDGMAAAVERAGASVLMVDARRRMPASGVSMAADLALTADHVVERDDEIRLVNASGEELSAVVAGRDPSSDLAVLRVAGGGLTPAQTAAARVGQLALALGRPSPDGIEASLGVVSAIGGPLRTRRGTFLEQVIRTDAEPYPGFSGGPLIDADGRVLGLNTSGLGRGLALTIPAALAWRIAETLAQHGKVRRGYLGVSSRSTPLSPAMQAALGRSQAFGLLLMDVERGGPAERGGLIVGDLLVSLAGQPLSDPDDLLVRLVGDVVGQDTPLEILRGGQKQIMSVEIGERP
jgi:S1-C subfamily serine protease